MKPNWKLLREKAPLAFALAAGLALWISPGALNAQENDGEAASSAEVDAPPGGPEAEPTYLDRHMAAARNAELLRMLRRDQGRLSILVRNFGDSVENASAEYETLQQSAREGESMHMQMEYVEARKMLEGARQSALDLYKKFSELFVKQSEGLLQDASGKLADAEQSLITDPGREGPNSRSLTKARYELKSAYIELMTARDLIQKQQTDKAIDHLRLSRLKALRILQMLAEDQAARESIANENAVLLIDSQGQVAPSKRPEPAAAQ